MKEPSFTQKVHAGAVVLVAILVLSASGSEVPSQETSSYPPALNVPTTHLTQPKTANPVQRSNCHPSYSGCLRADASDYDCAGGSGNGPYYTGTVRVVGPDVFGLDRDHDGWGCE